MKRIILAVALVAFMMSAGFATVLHVNNDSVVTDANNDMDSGVRSVPSGWHYKKNITINPPTPLDGYQIKITLNTSNIDYSHTTGDDLRFYQTDGTELPYYIESWNTSGTSTIWVKVETAGTGVIQMYYDNPTAAPKSNPDTTYDLYDDFNEDTLDLSKWTVYKGGSSNAIAELDGSGHLHLAGEAGVTSSANVESVSTFTKGYRITIKHMIDDEYYADVSLGTGTASGIDESTNYAHTTMTNGYFWDWQSPVSGNSATDLALLRTDGTTHTYLQQYDGGSMTTLNEWHTLDYVYDSNGNMKWYHDGTLWFESTDTTYLNDDKHLLVSQGAYSSYGGNRYIDSIVVRKYSDTEPSTVVGDEVPIVAPTLPGWAYRVNITLNPSTPDYNYQVKITLNASNFNYSHTQVNGNDLRFCLADGILLPYWIENWNNTGISTVWVNVSSITTSKIFMFYGNESAPSLSNPDTTFELYDNFSKTITTKYLTNWTKSSNNPLLTLNSQNWMSALYNDYDGKIYIFMQRDPSQNDTIFAWRFSPVDAANPANWEDLGAVFITTQSWAQYYVEPHGLIFETQAMADAREGVAPGQGTRMWRMYYCARDSTDSIDSGIGFATASETDLTTWTEYTNNPVYPPGAFFGYADPKAVIYQDKVWLLLSEYKSGITAQNPFYAYSDNGIDDWTTLSPWTQGVSSEHEFPQHGTLVAFDTGIQMIGHARGDDYGDYRLYFTSNGEDKASYSGNPILTPGTWDAHLRWTTIPIDKDGVPLKYNNNYFMFYVGSNSDDSVFALGLANGTTQAQETAHVIDTTKWMKTCKGGTYSGTIETNSDNTLHLSGEYASISSANLVSKNTFNDGIHIKIIRKYTDDLYVHVNVGNGLLQASNGGSSYWYDTVQGDGYDWWQDDNGHNIKKAPNGGAVVNLAGPTTFGALNTYETDEFIYDNNGVLKWLYNGTEEMSATDTDYLSDAKHVALSQGMDNSVGGDSYYDLVIVRKYADPEPTTTVGAEVYVYTPLSNNDTEDTTPPDDMRDGDNNDGSTLPWTDTTTDPVSGLVINTATWMILLVIAVVGYLYFSRRRRR